MWGGPKRNHVSSDAPVVQAWMGEISREKDKGIEFTTVIKPDGYHPALAGRSEKGSMRRCG
jgi:hypothetical protein